jgi:hypothetical protein
MALPYSAAELSGSPKLKIGVDGSSATRIFHVPSWDDAIDFAGAVLGSYKVTAGGTSITPPIPFPGFPFLLPTGIDIEAMGGDNARQDATPVPGLYTAAPSYNIAGAKITVTYSARFDDNGGGGGTPGPGTGNPPGIPAVPEGTWLEYSESFSAEMISVPPRSWRWDVAGNTTDPKVEDDVGVGILFNKTEINLTWHYVTSPPWKKMTALAGNTVNSKKFLRWGAGRVLYLGSECNKQFPMLDQEGANVRWRITHRFVTENKRKNDDTYVGWNHFFRLKADGTGDFQEIHDGTGKGPFREYDLDRLFTYALPDELDF